MQFKTHIAFSFLVSLFLIDFLKIKNQILFLIIVLFFSIFPDLDEHTSKISKKLRSISYITNSLFKHRSLFHSIWIPLILSSILFSINKIISIAILTGYISHLILDALTIKGLAPFSPIINKKIKGFIKVNSLLDNLLFYLFVVIIIYKLIYGNFYI
jgi:inner membrane protein